MSVLGPLGKGFELPPVKSVPLLVAGGMGVAPLCFLAQGLKKRRVEFLMGFATAGDIPVLDHLKGPQTRVSLATDDGSRGHAGFVTDLLERYLHGRGPGRNALSLFACGPRLMLVKVAHLALKHGLHCQVSLEASMACGLGACQGCAVKASKTGGRPYYHVCADGPVFEAGQIDWDVFQGA
jgi:dihydroorotate dehydrogenase electron transfer subunit